MTFERQSQSYRTLYSRPQGHRICVPQWPANKTIRFAAAAISWIGTRDYELAVDAVNKRAALFAFSCLSLAGGRVENNPHTHCGVSDQVLMLSVWCWLSYWVN